MKPIMKPITATTHVQFKNILFPPIFLDAAKAAVPYAAELAKRHNAKLYALHVRPPIANTAALPENWRALEKIAEMEAQREKFALVHTFEGMQPEIMIHEGDLWPNIKTATPRTGDLVHPSELSSSSGRMLRNLVPLEAELWCVPDYVVEYGAPAEKILETAAKRNAELIVLGAHKPTGLDGAATHLPMAVAHKVVSLAPCPVLTVRG